jgi:phenylacetic acid degradation protein PaaD
VAVGSPEDAIAWEVARRIAAGDGPSRAFGITLEDVAPGYAKLSMKVTEMMVNTAGILHGGFTFMLADSAFAVACNSYGKLVVARSCEIEFLAPAHAGDVLFAEASERRRLGRKGIYDVAVTRGDGGDPIAEFRGHGAGYSRAPAST